MFRTTLDVHVLRETYVFEG